MKARWDLSVFYRGSDDPAFAADLAAVPEKIEAANRLVAGSAQDVTAKPHAILSGMEEIGETLERLSLMTRSPATRSTRPPRCGKPGGSRAERRQAQGDHALGAAGALRRRPRPRRAQRAFLALGV